MKILEFPYERLFSTGKFENERIGMRVSVDETDDPDEVFKSLKAKTFHFHEIGKLLEGSKKAVESDKRLEPVKKAFSQNLANLLVFEEKQNSVIIKPKQFLGSDNFAKIASIVRELKGEYVSAGKESYFRISVAIEAANEARDKVTPTEVKTPTAVSEKEFDPEDLMKHDWKGKRIGEGHYSEGSLSWGWDFRDNFKAETLKALEYDGSLTIEGYKFTLSEKIVQTQKVKLKK